MPEKINFNKLVPLKKRKALNSFVNSIELEQEIDEMGIIIQPYRFLVGLGERHFRRFDSEIVNIEKLYPWTRKKHARFIMNELISNTQFSMLRQIITNLDREIPDHFTVTIHVNNSFYIVTIEEYGDFFDYYGYLENKGESVFERNEYEEMPDEKSREEITSLKDLSEQKFKIILNEKNRLVIPDDSNKLGLEVIENITDHDFYVSSYYRDGEYAWKSIYFRLENDTV